MPAFKLVTAIQELAAHHGAAKVLAAAHTALRCECKRCGRRWTPRIDSTPVMCPTCKSKLWQTARGE